MTACAQNDAGEGPSSGTRASQGNIDTITYDVNINGVDDNAVKARVRSVLQSELGTDKPPTSMLILRRRAENDIPVIEQALRGLGYYTGSAGFEIIDHPEPDNAAEDAIFVDATIQFEIDTGPAFLFGELVVDVLAETSIGLPSLNKLGFKKGQPADSSTVLDTERAILDHIKSLGYPFAKTADRDAIVDFDTETMDVTLRFETGAKTPFGPISFKGIDGIERNFLMERLNFVPGDQYEPRRLSEARQRLIATGLFSTVRVMEGSEPDSQGRLPIRFEATQRKHRSIGGGVSFRTDEGPGARLFWEHRNLLNAGERLRLELDVNQIRREASANLRKPDFLAVDQALLLNATGKTEKTDAFESRSLAAGIGIEKIFNKHITGSLGVAYRFVEIKEDDDEQLFGLLSVPGNVSLDYSDSLLDPSSGWRLFLDAAPFVDMLGIGTNFFKSSVTTTRYFRFWNEPRTVLALRGSTGAIFGTSRSGVPADERFYSGGGGSVRGLGFQLAGPVDDDNDPLGGASFVEFGTEFRVKAIGDLEFVTFFDGGTVFSTPLPNGSEDLQFGTGVGLRYISPVGPLRLDVGFPLDRRRNVDAAFQIYLSIGQAF